MASLGSMEDKSQFERCLIVREIKIDENEHNFNILFKVKFHPLLHVVANFCFICYAHSSNNN
mgnify:CR=1 FL=1